jgi:hypothetical protein
MEDVIFANAALLTANFADDFESSATEEAVRKHKELARCWNLEDKVLVLNALFSTLVKLLCVYLSAPRIAPEFSPSEHDRVIDRDLTKLLTASDRIIRSIGWFENRDHAVNGSRDFLAHFAALNAFNRELQRRLDPKAFRPNPRPVIRNESGQLFEVTGEPIEMPGLDPQSVLLGERQIEAGEVVSLNDLPRAGNPR